MHVCACADLWPRPRWAIMRFACAPKLQAFLGAMCAPGKCRVLSFRGRATAGGRIHENHQSVAREYARANCSPSVLRPRLSLQSNMTGMVYNASKLMRLICNHSDVRHAEQSPRRSIGRSEDNQFCAQGSAAYVNVLNTQDKHQDISSAGEIIACVCQVVEDVLEAMHADGSEAMPVPSSAYSGSTSRPSKIPLQELLQSFYDLR